MKLFGFGKKREEKKNTGCCGGAEIKGQEGACCCGKHIHTVKVLGAGCKNCRDLFEATKSAVKNAGLDIGVEYVTDMEKIMEYGVMSMPALVVDEQVVSMGKVLGATDVEKLLRKMGL